MWKNVEAEFERVGGELYGVDRNERCRRERLKGLGERGDMWLPREGNGGEILVGRSVELLCKTC